MSEYRQDPLSRRWVIIGSDRAARPNEFVEPLISRQPGPCPFCVGHEHETPDEVASYCAPGTGEWLVRVVPNKYPAVSVSEPLCPKCQPFGDLAPLGPIPGFGRHEVIIESPRHVASLSELTTVEAALVFRAYRDRIRDLKAEGRYSYVQIFKNVGAGAGASLEHVHSQLVALPGVPETLAQELIASQEFFASHQQSLVGKLLEQELAAGERVVASTGRLAAFCPFASRFPYEVWLAPIHHSPRFEDATDGELDELAQLARQVIGRIENATGSCAYNYFLHTQPFDMPAADHYHWHIEIIPRLTKVAGFEWSTGCFINPCPPEVSAARLRSSPIAADVTS